ncbi:MFS transporter [Candidatus Wolfebacteria bacterium]|nr:MFS transporter [Candidatus Wolfebacteria bacterium]
MSTRKNIFLWALYDFANSVVSIVFFLYFSQWIVIDQGVADIWFNLVFTIAAVLLLLSVPTTGALLDKYWRRITGLRYTTFGTVISYGLCGVLAILGYGVPALILFGVGWYIYLLSFTFYTPLLNDIASPERRGRVSGYGIAANYLGQIAGLILVLPFATGSVNLFGGSLRAETLLPSVVVFLLLALPMLIFFKEPHKEQKSFSLSVEIKQSLVKTKELFMVSGVLAFFLAYFFFNDAILTAANNFSIFLEQVWKVPDTTKTYILLGILITSAIGGLVSGPIADRFGHKKTLIVILSGLVVILPFIAWVSNFTLFVVATALMGLWFGSNWTVSRSLMSHLAPTSGHNLTFGYFGLVERASSLVGPVVWGLIATNLVSIGPTRYRIAATIVTLFILLGLVAMRKVPKGA